MILHRFMRTIWWRLSKSTLIVICRFNIILFDAFSLSLPGCVGTGKIRVPNPCSCSGAFNSSTLPFICESPMDFDIDGLENGPLDLFPNCKPFYSLRKVLSYSDAFNSLTLLSLCESRTVVDTNRLETRSSDRSPKCKSV